MERYAKEVGLGIEPIQLHSQEVQPDKSVGLVVVPASDGLLRVAYFQWVIELKSGRVADIDDSFRVKFIVPAAGSAS